MKLVVGLAAALVLANEVAAAPPAADNAQVIVQCGVPIFRLSTSSPYWERWTEETQSWRSNSCGNDRCSYRDGVWHAEGADASGHSFEDTLSKYSGTRTLTMEGPNMPRSSIVEKCAAVADPSARRVGKF